MPQPGHPDSEAQCSQHVRSFVRLSVRYKNFERNILKKNEPILMPTGRSHPQGKGMKRSTSRIRSSSNVKDTRSRRQIWTWRPGGCIILDPAGSSKFLSFYYYTQHISGYLGTIACELHVCLRYNVFYHCNRMVTAVVKKVNPLMGILKLQSNRQLYCNTVTGTLAVDGWAVTFGTAWAGCGSAQSPLCCTKCNSPLINGQCTNFVCGTIITRAH